MKCPKVRLYVRVRITDGRYRFLTPVWNRNRTLRSGYALVKGNAEHHPDGVYYLRFLRGTKRIWQSVGTDADAAMAALQNTEHDLRSISLGRSSSTPGPGSAPGPRAQVSLDEAITTYISQLAIFRSRKTVREATHFRASTCRP